MARRLISCVFVVVLSGLVWPALAQDYDGYDRYDRNDRADDYRESDRGGRYERPAPMVRGRTDSLGGEGYGGTVVFYRTASCGYCRKAERYMRSRGIPFVERYIERDPQARREYEDYGFRGVPGLVFGSERLNGYNEAKIDRLYARMQRSDGYADDHGRVEPAPRPVRPRRHDSNWTEADEELRRVFAVPR